MTAPTAGPISPVLPMVHLCDGDGRPLSCPKCGDDLFTPREAAGVTAYFCIVDGEQWHVDPEEYEDYEPGYTPLDFVSEVDGWELWARGIRADGTRIPRERRGASDGITAGMSAAANRDLASVRPETGGWFDASGHVRGGNW